MFRPEREAQVINGLQAANPGPLKPDNIAHIWREIMSACRAQGAAARWPTWARSGTFSEQAAAVLRLQHRARALRQHRRGVPRHRRGHRRIRRGAGGELHRRRDRPFARPVPADAAAHRRRDQPAGAPQPAAPDHSLEASRWCWPIRRRWRSAGLAEQPPAGRRAARGLQQCRGARLAAPTPMGGHRQRARGTEFGLHIAAHAIQDAAPSTAPASPWSACRRRWPPPRPRARTA